MCAPCTEARERREPRGGGERGSRIAIVAEGVRGCVQIKLRQCVSGPELQGVSQRVGSLLREAVLHDLFKKSLDLTGASSRQ